MERIEGRTVGSVGYGGDPRPAPTPRPLARGSARDRDGARPSTCSRPSRCPRRARSGAPRAVPAGRAAARGRGQDRRLLTGAPFLLEEHDVEGDPDRRERHRGRARGPLAGPFTSARTLAEKPVTSVHCPSMRNHAPSSRWGWNAIQAFSGTSSPNFFASPGGRPPFFARPGGIPPFLARPGGTGWSGGGSARATPAAPSASAATSRVFRERMGTSSTPFWREGPRSPSPASRGRGDPLR